MDKDKIIIDVTAKTLTELASMYKQIGDLVKRIDEKLEDDTVNTVLFYNYNPPELVIELDSEGTIGIVEYGNEMRVKVDKVYKLKKI